MEPPWAGQGGYDRQTNDSARVDHYSKELVCVSVWQDVLCWIWQILGGIKFVKAATLVIHLPKGGQRLASCNECRQNNTIVAEHSSHGNMSRLPSKQRYYVITALHLSCTVTK